MPTTAIKHLKPHPAQMRTLYDLDALAALALQVYERGLDTWMPILAAKNEAGFHIVSGHRRHMARLLAFALQDWAEEHPDPVRSGTPAITIEVARTMVHTLVESLGSLEALIASLITKYDEREVAFVSFEGGAKAEILALQAANYGGETPDVLGIAHSFRQAVEAGAAEEEIARNAGQHVNYVRNHLALTRIPPELAGRIAAGELPMSVAATVADLPEPKRTGLAIFILANPSASSGQAAGQLTAKAIKECAAVLKKWPGLQMPLMVKHQSQRNVARTLVRLWSQVVEAYPEDAYAAAAMLIYRDVHDEPWSSREKLTLWFQALGGDTYFTGGGIHWPAVVEHLLVEVSCASCPIARLPNELLRDDLSQGRGGPLGIPCRAGEDVARCLHGLAPSDPFDVRVPWSWSKHPGVVHEEEYRVKSYKDLLAAWQAQAAVERAEMEQAEDEAATSVAPDEADSRPPKPASEAPPPAVSPTPSTAGAEENKPSPIARQRAQIAGFMKQHEQLAANHPFATPCGRCRHRLESSPTKDDSVPHCAWAGRLRNVSFKVLESEDNGAPRVPVCRQFAPNQSWREILPAHPEPPGLPREWLKGQVLQLVQDANRHGGDHGGLAFEFLTGRPLSAGENYGDWFAQQLEAQGGDLSPAQLFTLFIWAHSEWQRVRRREFTLPVNGHGVQFSCYKEVSRPMKEES